MKNLIGRPLRLLLRGLQNLPQKTNRSTDLQRGALNLSIVREVLLQLLPHQPREVFEPSQLRFETLVLLSAQALLARPRERHSPLTTDQRHV
jgi:hypothetical protein